MAFAVYMLKCDDDSYYVGHTDDLATRFAQHQSGLAAGYTQIRRPVTLAFAETFQTREEALAMERRLKGWSRAKKEALADGDWNRISALGRKRFT